MYLSVYWTGLSVLACDGPLRVIFVLLVSKDRDMFKSNPGKNKYWEQSYAYTSFKLFIGSFEAKHNIYSI